MATLFTAPRSRQVVYTKDPNISSELDKLGLRRDFLTKLKKKAIRVLSEQIPLLKVLTTMSSRFVLPGVQSIKWNMARDITEQYGLQSFTILPWYTKAISITITGKAYLGAFATDITSSNGIVNTSLQPTGVVEYIREEMRDVDSLLTGVKRDKNTYAARNSILSSLAVGGEGEAGSIRVLGFIKGFSVDENVISPFVQSYTLDYLGVDMDWYISSLASNGRNLDEQPIPSMQKRTINGGSK